MIDKNVPNLAKAFKDYANELTSQSSILQLDDTWPSACTLDLYTQHLWGKQEYEESESVYLDGVAGYLAGLCYASWSHFPDAIDISILYNSDEYGPGVSIIAEGGRFLRGTEKVSINISQSLKFILSNTPDPFPVYYKFTRNINGGQNFIALFALGLFSGQSPFSKGAWKSVEPDKFQLYLNQCEQFLATSTAAYYQRVFPEETLGQIPELYLHNLILPSYEIIEKFPADLGTKTLLKKLAKSKEKPKVLKDIAINLAQLPCPFVSAAGFAVSLGLLNERLPDKLIAICNAKRDHIYELRPAVMTARAMLGKKRDWIQLANDNEFEEARKLLDYDCELGLCPIIKFANLELDNEEFIELFKFASWSYIDVVDQWFNDYDGEVQELPHSVLILKAYHAICKDNYKKAKSVIDILESKRTEENKFNESLCLLKSIYLIFTNELNEAINTLKDLSTKAENISLKKDAINYLLSSYIEIQDIEKANELIKKSIKLMNNDMNFLYNAILIARVNDDINEFTKLLEKALNLSPLDRRVFNLLSLNLAS